MALGGGTFTSQNKELPGAYINFVSAASASAALSDRGIATMPLELDWGVEGEVFEVTNEDFQKNSLKLFGYAFDSPKMLGLNDLFMGAKTLYAYRLNGGGDKAANTYATAKYCGVRGNDLKIVIQKNADDASNQSVLRQALLDYKNTGEDVYFEMQITNDDPTSDAGRQTIIFYDCNTDGGVLAKFDADGEYLDEEIEGTFEDFSMPESFANLTGFLTN